MQIVPICFDCWPNHWERLEKMFKRHKVKDAFVTSKQVCDKFESQTIGTRFHWLPEATDPLQWKPEKKLINREIDVLELGRKHEAFHNSVVQSLALQKKTTGINPTQQS